MRAFFILAVLLGAASAAPEPQRRPRAVIDSMHFLLWTKSNSGDNQYQELFLGDSNTLSNSNYKGSDPTILLIHGWQNSGYWGWPVDAKTELLKHGSYNVIAVDWEELAAAINYHSSVLDVPEVGRQTALFLEFLKQDGGMDTSTTQIIGHSLGAHISGAAGQNVDSFTVSRITGLDPAGPEFYLNGINDRLDSSDAAFVQAIHTNGGDVVDGCVGYFERSADADFYPNGGDHQPGCVYNGEDMTDLLVGGCSHGRSTEFWIESINGSPAFSSEKCSLAGITGNTCSTCSGFSCVQMGFNVDSSASGVYYLETNDSPPYALG